MGCGSSQLEPEDEAEEQSEEPGSLKSEKKEKSKSARSSAPPGTKIKDGESSFILEGRNKGLLEGSTSQGPNVPVPHRQFVGGMRRFVPLESLREEQLLRRKGSSNDFQHPVTGEFNADLTQAREDFPPKTVFVFVSHRWARPAAGGAGHPDDEHSRKLKLILGALDALKTGQHPCVASDAEFAVWIDYCCVDQDGTPAAELVGSIGTLIAECDLVLTPVIDSEHDGWSDVFQEYQASSWQEYWTRAWCRVEAMLAAVKPVSEPAHRAELFHGTLAAAVKRGRRPHILFGSKELAGRWPPVFLPPLLNATFQKYMPERGNLTCEDDRSTIHTLTAEARKLIHDVVPGWKGSYRGDGEGRGKYVYPDGSVYTGFFKNGVKHGQGTYLFGNGSKYSGQWAEGKKHGHGRYEHVNGDVYEGQYVRGRQEGEGKFTHADGEMYDGQWEAGHRTGTGKYIMRDGSLAHEGKWRDSIFLGADAAALIQASVLEGLPGVAEGGAEAPASAQDAVLKAPPVGNGHHKSLSVPCSADALRTGDPAAEADAMPCSVHETAEGVGLATTGAPAPDNSSCRSLGADSEGVRV